MSIVDPSSGSFLTPSQPTSTAATDAPPGDEQLIIDVDSNNIQQLLELSMQVPVLLDCWAPWCQPCKVLMPILEKLTREYRGTFILAKLNIDENQEIAAQLGVHSVPDVKLISQGGLVDHFQGALPEEAPASPEEQAAEALAQGDAATARAMYEQLVQQNPEHYSYQVELARALVMEERADEALTLLDNLPPEERDAAAARGVRASIEFRAEAPGDEELAALAGRDDSEAQFKRAMRQVADGDYETGLESLLNLMRTDRAYGDDIARKTLLRVFDTLGAEHPLTVTYRRRLFTLLY